MGGTGARGRSGGGAGSRKRQRPPGPTPLLAVGALGVVYGDLGTSPLYTMQTIVSATGSHFSDAAALGVLSLIFWTLLITISTKYCLVVMRADNHGEGGILALMSLIGANEWRKGAYLGAVLGLVGASLIYGDGVITPAISVLSALEGVKVATPALTRFVLPTALVILLGLFAVQRFGTGKIGGAFGPVMLVWFIVIGALGLIGILRHPMVLAAVNPWYGITFLIHSKGAALLILSGVFLCATGGEALYADLGHFGRAPIRLAWYLVVLPACLLSYAGQTAILIGHGASSANPFFQLAPPWALYPLVALSTVATIIASQAIIAGAFSMTQQAIQLGWLPLFNIRQTSRKAIGQIYVPVVNWMMAAATMAITLSFRSSDRLVGAFGMAVSTTMLLTTLLLYRVMRKVWRWPRLVAVGICTLFTIVDASFFCANLLKLVDGGYVPLTLGAAIFIVMITWRSGIQRVRAAMGQGARSVEKLKADMEARGAHRTPGVAVFLTRSDDEVPAFIDRYVSTTGALHDQVIVLSIHFEATPRLGVEGRGGFRRLTDGFWQVDLHYGFMETPDVIEGLKNVGCCGDEVDLSQAVFFGTRDFVTRAKQKAAMAAWRTGLFAFLYRNGVRMTDRFNLPPERTIELAREIEI